MSNLSFARFFRLHPGGVECDAGGLRVGGVALLARDANGAWTRRDEGNLTRELSKLYGVPLDFGSKRSGVDAVAAALTSGEIARAQVAALLLRLPDPPTSAGAQSDGANRDTCTRRGRGKQKRFRAGSARGFQRGTRGTCSIRNYHAKRPIDALAPAGAAGA